jgi:hypothetical protein
MTEPERQPEPAAAKNVVAFKRRSAEPRKPTFPMHDETSDGLAGDDRARNRTNVAVLLFAAVLVFLGWLLVRELGKSAHMQDCLASGRTNCAPIETPVE